MNDIVDSVIKTYELTGKLTPERLAYSREKIIGYIDVLASTGHNDNRQLKVFALAYLKEMHEGPDKRFTGC